MPASAIEALDVEKSFGPNRAVRGATLRVRKGELVALLGPSGSGKTTLLRLIAGFEVPDAGRVCIGGREVAGAAAWVEPDRRRLGMVFQDGALFPHLTVAANLAFGRPRRGRAQECLELVGLAGRSSSYPHELSGGERQRVALARALAADPEAMLLDEPFAALDEGLRVGLRAEVARVLRAAGASTLLVTHNQQEALSLADQVAVLRDGRIEQVGPPEEIYDRPVNRWVAEFLGDADVLPGTAADGTVRTELGRFPADRGAARPGRGGDPAGADRAELGRRPAAGRGRHQGLGGRPVLLRPRPDRLARAGRRGPGAQPGARSPTLAARGAGAAAGRRRRGGAGRRVRRRPGSVTGSLATAPTPVVAAPEPGTTPSWLGDGRLLLLCLVVAAASTSVPAVLGFDPWVWLVWGRELLRGELATDGTVAWKPLPVLVNALLAPFGAAAPALWTVLARTGGLFGLVLVFRLAVRFAGPGRQAGPVAGVVAGAAFLLTPDGEARWVRHLLQANIEPATVALCLWAVHRHLDGHRGRRCCWAARPA